MDGLDRYNRGNALAGVQCKRSQSGKPSAHGLHWLPDCRNEHFPVKCCIPPDEHENTKIVTKYDQRLALFAGRFFLFPHNSSFRRKTKHRQTTSRKCIHRSPRFTDCVWTVRLLQWLWDDAGSISCNPKSLNSREKIC